MATRLYHPNNYKQPRRNRFWYLQIVCWHQQVWITKHPFKSKRSNERNAEMYWSRPDIVIRERNCITVVEVMCPFETNLLKSHDYKVSKYQNLHSALPNPCSHFKLILLEISSHDFTGSPIKIFETYLNGRNCKSSQKMSRSCKTCFILHLL